MNKSETKKWNKQNAYNFESKNVSFHDSNERTCT